MFTGLVECGVLEGGTNEAMAPVHMKQGIKLGRQESAKEGVNRASMGAPIERPWGQKKSVEEGAKRAFSGS